MLKKSLLFVIIVTITKEVSAVEMLGKDYPLTIVIPIFLIIAVIVFFATTYIKDHWKKIKASFTLKKHKEEKEEEKKKDFSKEFRILTNYVKNQSNTNALESIINLTKDFISSKIEMVGNFSFEEIPKEKLSKSTQDFLNKISELKYTEKEVKREDISKLMNSLSILLNDQRRYFHKEKKKIELRFPKLRFPKFKFAGKKSIMKKNLTLKEIEKLDNKLLRLIRKLENSLNNPERAIRLYEKASEINKIIPHSRLTPKLREVDKIILRHRKEKEGIEKARIEKINKIRTNSITKAILNHIEISKKNINRKGISSFHYERAKSLYNQIPKNAGLTSKLNLLNKEILGARQKDISKELEKIVHPKKVISPEEKTRRREIAWAKNKVQKLITKLEKKFSYTNYALRLHSRLVKINHKIPNSEFTPKISKLYKKIIDYKQEQERKRRAIINERERKIKALIDEKNRTKEKEKKAIIDQRKKKIMAKERRKKAIIDQRKAIFEERNNRIKEAEEKKKEIREEIIRKRNKIRKEVEERKRAWINERKRRIKGREEERKELILKRKREKRKAEINKIRNKILRMMKVAERKYKHYNRAMKLYNKAEKLNKEISQRDITSKLNKLHMLITNNRKHKINVEKEMVMKTTEEKLKKLIKKIKKHTNNYHKTIRLYNETKKLCDNVHKKREYHSELGRLKRKAEEIERKKHRKKNHKVVKKTHHKKKIKKHKR